MKNFLRYFNSLPHTEVDYSVELFEAWVMTFQLTTSHRGRRLLSRNAGVIHLFQLTTSHRGRLSRSFSSSMASAFQLTTSHRGRQQFVTKFRKNIHKSHNKSHNKSLFFLFQVSYNNYKTLKKQSFSGANLPEKFCVLYIRTTKSMSL